MSNVAAQEDPQVADRAPVDKSPGLLDSLALVPRVALSCAAGFAAGIIAVFVTAAGGSEPAWLSGSVMALVSAAAWMLAGLRVAGPHAPIAAPLLFLSGAAVAWLLNRGLVHSVSAYYGLFEFTVACLSALLAASIYMRSRASVRTRILCLALPVITLAIVYPRALIDAPLSHVRTVELSDSTTAHVSVVQVRGEGSHGTYYVRSGSEHALVQRDSARLLLEIDPGSGLAGFRALEVRDAEQIRAACARFRAHTAAVVGDEVRRGSMPGFMTWIPVRYQRCEAGRIWLAFD